MRIILELGDVSQTQLSIDAVQRAIDGKPLACDFHILVGVKSILEGIKKASEK